MRIKSKLEEEIFVIALAGGGPNTRAVASARYINVQVSPFKACVTTAKFSFEQTSTTEKNNSKTYSSLAERPKLRCGNTVLAKSDFSSHHCITTAFLFRFETMRFEWFVKLDDVFIFLCTGRSSVFYIKQTF